MSKHTHTGHCQACGREQAINVNRGTLAKHGYKVAGWGFFMGTCPGSDRFPLEVEKTYSVEIINMLAVSEAAHKKSIEDLKTGKEIPATVKTGTKERRNEAGLIVRDRYGRRVYDDVIVLWDEATVPQRGAEIIRLVRDHENGASQCAAHIRFLHDAIAAFHGQPLKPVEAPKAALQVGQQVQVSGQTVTVEGFAERRVGFRGRTATHIVFTVNGRTCYALPRYCK
jgi:hypothetical protein